ncbi:MAG: anthranilate phosphoribosyltransferase, partial [Anaerolineae bacterium]|nr:anthranilate phosphoribosyltransferase [Anaerolineae bacterium]
MDIKRAIDLIGKFGHLQSSEAEAVMNDIMRGEVTQAQIGAYLMGLRMKGETLSEITGSAIAMRANSEKVPTKTAGSYLLD